MGSDTTDLAPMTTPASQGLRTAELGARSDVASTQRQQTGALATVDRKHRTDPWRTVLATTKSTSPSTDHDGPGTDRQEPGEPPNAGRQYENGARPRVEAVPIGIGHTTPRCHITGIAALNIPRPLQGGGDWHKHDWWFGIKKDELEKSDYSDEETYGELLDRLGGHGVVDGRNGLASLEHPAGRANAPIWTASYDRAIIELAWKGVITRRRLTNLSTPERNPVDPREAARWLNSPVHWARLKWWARKLRADLDGEELRRWDRWQREWSPWA